MTRQTSRFVADEVNVHDKEDSQRKATIIDEENRQDVKREEEEEIPLGDIPQGRVYPGNFGARKC